MTNYVDELNKQYLINAELYDSLKYMVIDFLADYKSVNIECSCRKAEIDELIGEIDRTRLDYRIMQTKAVKVVGSEADEAFKSAYRQYQKDNFLNYYRECNGNMDKVSQEMLDDFRRYYKRK